MAIPVVVSPDTCYATKGNIGHPGTSAQRTTSATQADTDLESRLTPITVAGVVITAAR